MKTVNLNDRVRVTLTAAGAGTLNAHNHAQNEHVKSHLRPGAVLLKRHSEVTNYTAGSVYTSQLWCLMNIFSANYNGMPETVFEGNTIEVLT